MSRQDRGRWLVIAIVCITLVGHTVFVVLPAVHTKEQGWLGLLIGYGLVAGVLCALWRGYHWARWLLFVLCAAGSVWASWLVIESPSAFIILRALHFIVVALLLAASPSVALFLAGQRDARREA